jgi:hypothetical protein
MPELERVAGVPPTPVYQHPMVGGVDTSMQYDDEFLASAQAPRYNGGEVLFPMSGVVGV